MCLSGTHLYEKVCPLVCRSHGPSVRPSVHPSVCDACARTAFLGGFRPWRDPVLNVMVNRRVLRASFTILSLHLSVHRYLHTCHVFNHAKKKKEIAQLLDDSWFVHRRRNYKKSVSILKSFKKSINWVVSWRCSSKTLETTMIWSKDVNFAYCQKERFHINLWNVPSTFI